MLEPIPASERQKATLLLAPAMRNASLAVSSQTLTWSNGSLLHGEIKRMLDSFSVQRTKMLPLSFNCVAASCAANIHRGWFQRFALVHGMERRARKKKGLQYHVNLYY